MPKITTRHAPQPLIERHAASRWFRQRGGNQPACANPVCSFDATINQDRQVVLVMELRRAIGRAFPPTPGGGERQRRQLAPPFHPSSTADMRHEARRCPPRLNAIARVFARTCAMLRAACWCAVRALRLRVCRRKASCAACGEGVPRQQVRSDV